MILLKDRVERLREKKRLRKTYIRNKFGRVLEILISIDLLWLKRKTGIQITVKLQTIELMLVNQKGIFKQRNRNLKIIENAGDRFQEK